MIWILADSKRLSAKARKALHAGPLVLSVVSFWEIVLKARKGSLDIADPVHWWSRATDLSGGVILSNRAAHISVLAGLPPIHKDPFDRMLIAQAAAEGLAIITATGNLAGIRSNWFGEPVFTLPCGRGSVGAGNKLQIIGLPIKHLPHLHTGDMLNLVDNQTLRFGI